MRERIVFFGRNKGYGITLLCFKELIKLLKKENNHSVVSVVTTDDGGYGYGTLRGLAQKEGISLLSAKGNDVNEPSFCEKLKRLEPTLFLVVQFPKIFSRDLIRIPSRACLNIHRGWPLRGGSIDERIIVGEHREYSLILHHIDEGVDTGNIIGRVSFAVSRGEHGYSLVKKADSKGRDLLKKYFFPLLGNDIPEGLIQQREKTVYGSKDCIQALFDPEMSFYDIEKLIRAFHHPRKKGVQVSLNDRIVYLHPGINFQKKSHNLSLGSMDIIGDNLRIACRDGFILIKFLYDENGSRMSAAATFRRQ